MNHVYFIRGGDRVKIGSAADPYVRRDSMQIGSPVKLILLGYYVESYRHEFALHEQFDHLRLHGEWFRLTDDPELRAAIERGEDYMLAEALKPEPDQPAPKNPLEAHLDQFDALPVVTNHSPPMGCQE